MNNWDSDLFIGQRVGVDAVRLLPDYSTEKFIEECEILSIDFDSDAVLVRFDNLETKVVPVASVKRIGPI